MSVSVYKYFCICMQHYPSWQAIPKAPDKETERRLYSDKVLVKVEFWFWRSKILITAMAGSGGRKFKGRRTFGVS